MNVPNEELYKMIDFFVKQFKENGADGIDFVPLIIDDLIPQIYKTYTREQFENDEVSR